MDFWKKVVEPFRVSSIYGVRQLTLFIGDYSSLHIILNVLDRDQGREIQVSHTTYLPGSPSSEESLALDLATDWFAYALRRALRQVMEHEVDESILVEGQRPFDPHKEENNSPYGEVL